LYGRSKALGEVSDSLTLRTSIIGRELAGRQGLVEWFLSNRGGSVKGFSRAFFSGVTTDELSRVVARVLLDQRGLAGVWQVASQKIDKQSLLGLLNGAYRVGATIEQDDTVCVDRSLDGSAFEKATGYRAPAWPEMVAAMAADPTPYDKWKER
jgi:dTDP-4-dehydrorhamnose reductase